MAKLTESAFGDAPDTLCNHIRYLRAGSMGQIFWNDSWKQIVTLEVIYAVSFVALIFPGDLASYISTGIGLLLLTSMIVNLIITLAASSPGILSGYQEAPTVILGSMAVAIATQFSASTATVEVLPTIVAAFGHTSILTGYPWSENNVETVK
ncbi:MAG: hypothetical protein MUF49_14060 [Oculatellaceae cyanobacterium Prado106]|nr:hypothetical protein [Oculatellaceae cyanobacterium Prado106]